MTGSRCRLGAAFILAAAVTAAVGCGSSPSPTAESEGFPTDVLGMPVVTVGGAQALIDAGAVNGRALAVGGWWIPGMMMSCPMPMRWMAELEAYCLSTMFASRGFQAVVCRVLPDSTECRGNDPPPGTAIISPVTTTETSGGEDLLATAAAPAWRETGAPAVVIGHAGDPRLLHCPAESRNECAHRFVIDRVVWLAGNSLEIRPSDRRVNPGMVVNEALAAADFGDEAISGVAIRSRDVSTIDPRLHSIGDQPAWVVRALRVDEGRLPEDPTRGIDEVLVDDASGEVLARTGLEMAADFQTALLLVQATEVEACCANDVYPFYRVDLPDGTGVQEMLVGGGASSGRDNRTRHGAGMAVVLEPRDYVVTVWRSTVGRDESSGPPHDQCSAEITIDAGATLRLEAAFPANGSCEFVPPTFENPFDG